MKNRTNDLLFNHRFVFNEAPSESAEGARGAKERMGEMMDVETEVVKTPKGYQEISEEKPEVIVKAKKLFAGQKENQHFKGMVHGDEATVSDASGNEFKVVYDGTIKDFRIFVKEGQGETSQEEAYVKATLKEGYTELKGSDAKNIVATAEKNGLLQGDPRAAIIAISDLTAGGLLNKNKAKGEVAYVIGGKVYMGYEKPQDAGSSYASID